MSKGSQLHTPARFLVPGHRLALGMLALSVLALSMAGCGNDLTPTSTRTPIAKTGVGLPGGWISTPRLFVSGITVTSMAATHARLLAATVGAPTKLVELTEDGQIRPFAPGFGAGDPTSCFLQIAPGDGSGPGAFPQGQILAGVGSDIWSLSQSGDAAVVLATLPAEDGDIRGLACDLVGGFGYDLVVLTGSGTVYRVDCAGRTIRIGSFGLGACGPGIASARFADFAGQLLAAFPNANEVRAMDGGGNVSSILRWPSVSSVCTLADEPRAFGASDGALFLATETGTVQRYPLADLTSRGGELVLTSLLRSGSGIVTPELGGFRIASFSRFVGAELVAASVRRPAVIPIDIEVQPGEPNKTIVAGSTQLLPVGLFASTGFVPTMLSSGEVQFAGAEPVRPRNGQLGTSTDLNGDGRLDLLLQFRPAEMQLESGDATLTLEGQAFAGDRVRGAAHVLVLAP